MAAGQEHLQGDHPPQPLVPGLVNDAHAAPSQFADDFVTGTERPAGIDSLTALSGSVRSPWSESGRDPVSESKVPGRLTRAGLTASAPHTGQSMGKPSELFGVGQVCPCAQVESGDMNGGLF